MARKSGSMICTSECSECVHSNLDVKNITLKFHCNAKDKDYFYGQYIPCDLKETVNGNKREQVFGISGKQ